MGVKTLLYVAAVSLLLTACGEVGSPQSTASTQPDSNSTDTNSPSPAALFKTIVLKGSGSRLTNQFELPAGDYKVSWSIKAAGGYCCPNLIADMVGQDKTNLAASSDPSGSTLFQSDGGFFRIQTDASGTAWIITIERL